MHLEVDKNKIKSGLYIVATPIGNLSDITLRAIEILKKSNFILCEDIRLSKKLMNKYNINTELISNHKFNEKKNLLRVLNILKSNKIVSLISDAGTPTISDPGKILINECINNDILIYSVPGPSSVAAAVSTSGFSDKYYFHGFLPDKISAIDKDLNFLSKLNFTVVFFISPKKVNKVIDLIKKYFGDRNIVFCREMTKIYEEYYRNEVQKLTYFKQDLKGEITVVISEKKDLKNKQKILGESDKSKIKKLINKLTIKDIVSLISDEKNIPKSIIYNYCLKIKNEN